MPEYTETDPRTGRTLVFTGPAKPSRAVVAAAFAKLQAASPLPPPAPGLPPTDVPRIQAPGVGMPGYDDLIYRGPPPQLPPFLGGTAPPDAYDDLINRRPGPITAADMVPLQSGGRGGPPPSGRPVASPPAGRGAAPPPPPVNQPLPTLRATFDMAAGQNFTPQPPTPPLAFLQQPLEAAFDVARGATVGTDWSQPASEESAWARGGELLAALPVSAPMKALRAFVKGAKGTPLAGRGFPNLAETLIVGEGGTYTLKPEVVERLRSLYELGTSAPRTSNWAGAPSEELLEAFGGDKDAALMWARYWGATSPNTSVPRNTQESVRAWLSTLEHPERAITVPRAQQMGITMAPAKVPNLNRAAWNEPLSPGTKVEAMAEYMAGRERIPIDVHALYALTGEKTLLDPQYKYLRALMTQAEGLPAKITKGVGLTKVDLYTRYEEALSKALKEIAPDRQVTEVFADLWEGARAHKGRAPQGGPIDILRKKGLLGIGAMLDPKALRAALRQKGWTAVAIAGLFSSLGLAQEAATGESGESGDRLGGI